MPRCAWCIAISIPWKPTNVQSTKCGLKTTYCTGSGPQVRLCLHMVPSPHPLCEFVNSHLHVVGSDYAASIQVHIHRVKLWTHDLCIQYVTKFDPREVDSLNHTFSVTFTNFNVLSSQSQTKGISKIQINFYTFKCKSFS